MVFQSYALYPHMSVYENIAFLLAMVATPAEIVVAVREAARVLDSITCSTAPATAFRRAAAALRARARHRAQAPAFPPGRAAVESRRQLRAETRVELRSCSARWHHHRVRDA